MESQQQRPNGKTRADEAGRTLGQRVDQVSGSAQQAWSRTRDTVTDLRGAVDLEGRVNRNPYGTIAAAVGIGYVLGGGLFSPLTARIVKLGLRIGLRLAVLPLVKDELFGLAASLEVGTASDENR
jgi:ElaB/YqjD/DUF883 family membrane-anchored ribosome-binding protein